MKVEVPAIAGSFGSSGTFWKIGNSYSCGMQHDDQEVWQKVSYNEVLYRMHCNIIRYLLTEIISLFRETSRTLIPQCYLRHVPSKDDRSTLFFSSLPISNVRGWKVQADERKFLSSIPSPPLREKRESRSTTARSFHLYLLFSPSLASFFD